MLQKASKTKMIDSQQSQWGVKTHTCIHILNTHTRAHNGESDCNSVWIKGPRHVLLNLWREKPSDLDQLGLTPIGGAPGWEGCLDLDNFEGERKTSHIKGNGSSKSQWEEMSSHCVNTWDSTERKLPDSGHFRHLLKLRGKTCVPTTWRRCLSQPRAGHSEKWVGLSITKRILGSLDGIFLCFSWCSWVFVDKKTQGAGT